MERRSFVSVGLTAAATITGGVQNRISTYYDIPHDIPGMGESRIYNNPYSDVDWNSYGQFKADHHIHWRGFGSEPSDTIDVMTNGSELNGTSLKQDDWYEVFGVGSQAENEEPYWGTDDCGWTDMDIRNSEWETRNPKNKGINGVISFPSQEIDDIEHICHLFSVSSPQDFDYYPGEGGKPPGDYDDLQEALPKIIENTCNTIVSGRGQVVIAHPSRYYDSPADGFERYLPFFEEYDLCGGLLGLEIFEKGLHGNYGGSHDLKENFEMWDLLLEELLPERPVWGFAANDCNNGDWGDSYGPDLRWWTVLLSDDEFDPSNQRASQIALKQALRDGRFYISQRRPYEGSDPSEAPETPSLRSVNVNHDAETITIDVDWPDNEGSIDWYSNGDVIETGETIEIEEDYTPYVRAHAYIKPTDGSDHNDGEIATQPFTIVDDDYEPRVCPE